MRILATITWGLSSAILIAACGAGSTTPTGGPGGGSGGGSGSGSSSGGSDGTSGDGGTVTTVGANEPAGPSPGNCYPVSGQTGNEKHVGAYCQKSGGQCSTYGNLSLQCSTDLSAQGGNFCLIVGCTKDSDCGTDSCCSGPSGSIVRACIPIGCFEAGVCSIIAPTGSD